MLILSRTVDERIKLGDDIEIVITKVRGNRVSIGITAPKDVKIVRSELDSNKESGNGVA
jgi:carbon storage regulator